MENKLSILYAEDDALGAELIKAILERNHFLVDIASDGEKAWESYKRKKPDILLLDLDMPQKNGLEVTRLIREQDKQTHIIVYTSHGEAEREIAILDAGADEFICKERPLEVLIAHLNRIGEKIMKNMVFSHVYRLSPDHNFIFDL